MVCVEGLASDERVVGFVMDGVLYAADDAVALTGQEMWAVVEDTSVTFESPDAAQWNIPQWQSVLRKGESAVYYGRMTSDGKLNYNTIHVLLWQTLDAQGGADGVVRMDWYVQGQDSDVATTNVPDMNWTVTKRLGPDDWTTYLATIQSSSVTVVLQWKNPECLQVAYFVQGDNGISFPMIYDIRAASGSLPDWYCIGLSYEYATATLERHEGCEYGADHFCDVCGAVDRAALDAAASAAATTADANGSVTVSGDFAVKATFTLGETATSSELFLEFQEANAAQYFDYNFADLNFWGTLSNQPSRYVSGALPTGVAQGTYTLYVYRIGTTLYMYLAYTPLGAAEEQFAMSIVQKDFYTGEGIVRIAGGHSALENLTVKIGTLA